MPIPIPKTQNPPKIQRLSSKNWLKGTVTAFDDGRTPVDGLRASGNMLLDQDGVLRPRPSLRRYGSQPVGTILGEMFEFVKAGTTENTNYLITMQNVSGTTRIYYSKDGGAWTQATGKTYDNAALAHFFQSDNKVIIQNGVDNLSYFDIPTLAVIPFTALPAMTAPTTAPSSGLSGTTFKYWYAVSANSSVGETAATSATQAGVLKRREQWVAATEYVDVTWSAVAGAKSYNVYLAQTDPAQGGTPVLLAAGIAGLSYRDNGSQGIDVNTPAPLGDTTAGPICTRGAEINGQIFLVGDRNNPQYVRYGGTGTSILDFSPFNGGGWTELGRGGKEFPVKVIAPPANSDTSIQAMVLCRGTNGKGKRYKLSPSSITVGTTTITFFESKEDNGQVGTDSPDAAILYDDKLWYPSRDGFKSTGTKPQLQTFISTDTVSETIITDIPRLTPTAMDKAVAIGYQERLYFALPVGATMNNEIWILDLLHDGAWMKPWNIAASWMVLYNSNSPASGGDGQTHFLVLSNNIIYELTYSVATSDDGVPFSTNATSGLIKFSEDSMEWAKVTKIHFILQRPQGQINFNISGKTEDAAVAPTGSTSFQSSTTVAGWGEAGWGGSPDKIYGWSNASEVPVSFGDAQKTVTIEVDEVLNWIRWEVNTSSAGVDFALADVVVEYVNVGVISQE